MLGYEAVASERERSVLILSTHGRAAAPAMVEDLATRCDGMVVMGRTVADEVVERLVARGMPVVLLARPPIGEVDSVNADNRGSAVLLGRHVLERGARRITFVGDPDASPGRRRALGRGPRGRVRRPRCRPRRAAQPASARTPAPPSPAPPSTGEDDLPDAFVCANDELALGLMDELADAGVAVPGGSWSPAGTT